MNLDDENLWGMKLSTCTANQYFQNIRILLLQYIKVNFSELLSASPITSPASPVLGTSCTHSPSSTSVSEQALWTGSIVLRIFLKTEKQKGSQKLVVSLMQVSRNLIPAVSAIHHLPSCSTFSSDILINSCYAMIYDDFNLPPASLWPREFPGG